MPGIISGMPAWHQSPGRQFLAGHAAYRHGLALLDDPGYARPGAEFWRIRRYVPHLSVALTAMTPLNYAIIMLTTMIMSQEIAYAVHRPDRCSL